MGSAQLWWSAGKIGESPLQYNKIIIIVHVQQALELSWAQRDFHPDKASLFHTTIGIIFLGTPHHVASLQGWSTILNGIADAASRPLNGDFDIYRSKSKHRASTPADPLRRRTSPWSTANPEPPGKDNQKDIIQDPITFKKILEQGRIFVYSYFEYDSMTTQKGAQRVSLPLYFCICSDYLYELR